MGGIPAEELDPATWAEWIPLVHSIASQINFTPDEVNQADKQAFSLASRLNVDPDLQFFAGSFRETFDDITVSAVTSGQPRHLVVPLATQLNVTRCMEALRRQRIRDDGRKATGNPAAVVGPVSAPPIIMIDPTTSAQPVSLLHTGTVSAPAASVTLPAPQAPSSSPPPAVTTVLDENGLLVQVRTTDIRDFDKDADPVKSLVLRRLADSEVLAATGFTSASATTAPKHRKLDPTAFRTKIVNTMGTLKQRLYCSAGAPPVDDDLAMSPWEKVILRFSSVADSVPAFRDPIKFNTLLSLEEWSVPNLNILHLVPSPLSPALSIPEIFTQIELTLSVVFGPGYISGMFDAPKQIIANVIEISLGLIPKSYVLYCYSVALQSFFSLCRRTFSDPKDPTGNTPLDLTRGHWGDLWSKSYRSLARVSIETYTYVTTHRLTSSLTALSTPGPTSSSQPVGRAGLKRTATPPNHSSTKSATSSSEICFNHLASLLKLSINGDTVTCRHAQCHRLHPTSLQLVNKRDALVRLNEVSSKLHMPQHIKDSLQAFLTK